MNFWVITDTHFGHDKMLEYCGRPNKFEDLILDNLYKQVQEEDVVIHLGDVALSQNNDYWLHEYLITPGRKWLIKGNHDTKSVQYYLQKGFDSVSNIMNISIFGRRVIFSHKPVFVGENDIINLHGHFHNASIERWEKSLTDIMTSKNHLLILENNNYKCWNLEQLMGKIR